MFTFKKVFGLKLSKKEILALNDIHDFKHISNTHMIDFKVNNKNLRCFVLFNSRKKIKGKTEQKKLLSS